MIRLLVLSFCLTITFSTLNAGAQELPTPQKRSHAAASDPWQELGKVVEQYVSQQQAVGAELLIIQSGESVYHESFGYSAREENRPWENETLCNIRSMTKPLTSAAAQILIDRHQLNLDDPVANYLESFKEDEDSKLITVRQVLTHRSGLPLTNLVSPNQFASLAEQVDAAGQRGPQFEPGSKFWYSDIGTDVVGRLVEKVSGEPLHQFVQREIFDPLGMSSTIYGIDASDQRLLKAASGYMKIPNGWNRFWTPEKPLYPFAWGSQTVYSTTTDYAKFLQMMVNGGRVGDQQLLSTAAVERMLEPVSRMKMLGSDAEFPTGFRDLEVFYGQMMVTHRPLGKEKEKPVVIGHSGSDGTNAWAWPERDLLILYFTQSRGGMTPLRIEEPIDRLIIHPGESIVQTPDDLLPYVGTFVPNDDKFDGEEFSVQAKNGKLVLDIPSQMAFELIAPDDEGYWAFAIVPDQVKVTFDRDENEGVVGLKIHQAGQIVEVPRKGTARAKELADKRIADKAAALEKMSKEKLKEAWVGRLDLGAMKPVMQFRIVSNESGETVAYFDSVTEGRTGFDATWSINGDQLEFDVASIKLSYRGKLNETNDSADGTWSQGGREFPLTLKKQSAEFSAPKE